MSDENRETTENDGGSEPDPMEVFMQANTEFQERLGRIDGNSPQASRQRIEAVDAFIEEVARVDPRESLKRQVISIVNDAVDFMTKSAAERELNEAIRDSSVDTERPEITELLVRNVASIEKLSSGETEGEVRYRFVFSGGDSLIIDPETLYSPTEFRRAYNGVYDVLPRFDGEQDDWEDLLHRLQDRYLVEKTDSVGPRAQAIDQLRSRISQSEAYIEAGVAVRKGNGVFIDADSREAAENASTVWIASAEVKRVCEDNDITPEALRVELDNRDLRGGTTEEHRFDGRKARFWPLERREFEPKLIEADDGNGNDGEETTR